MIWVLLQSESPWQRNDAITFFIYLCVLLVVHVHMKLENNASVNNEDAQLSTQNLGGKLVIFEALFKSLPYFQCS